MYDADDRNEHTECFKRLAFSDERKTVSSMHFLKLVYHEIIIIPDEKVFQETFKIRCF